MTQWQGNQVEENKNNAVYCIRIEPYMVDDVWDKALPFLQNPEIGETEFLSIEEVKQSCHNGTAQLWILMEGDELVGCFNTNFGEASETVSVLNIFNLSGHNVASWIHVLDKKICEFCKEHNCQYYMFIGRQGFSKFLPQLKNVGVAYVRTIGAKNE